MPFGLLHVPKHPLRRATDFPRKRTWQDYLIYLLFFDVCVIIGMLHPAYIAVFMIGVLCTVAMMSRM